VSNKGSPNFVPIEYRIAIFDMDGTIMVEKPSPFNFEFMLNYLKDVGESSPLLQNIQPYKAVLNNNSAYILNNTYQVQQAAFLGYSQSEYKARAIKFANTQ